MFIPFESDTEVMNQIQFYEDYYNLLISAAVLGGMKRSLNATLESHSMRTMGSSKMIKSGLVKSQLARTQTPLYKLKRVFMAQPESGLGRANLCQLRAMAFDQWRTRWFKCSIASASSAVTYF